MPSGSTVKVEGKPANSPAPLSAHAMGERWPDVRQCRAVRVGIKLARAGPYAAKRS